jgi:hypothetical protein
MKYIKAYSLVTIAQLTGYTDRTPTLKQDNNFCRLLCWMACGFEFKSRKDKLPVSFTTQSVALTFFFTLNQN